MSNTDKVVHLFDKWGKRNRGEDMEKGHWPRVKQAFETIPEKQGNFLEIGVGNGYALRHMAENQFRKGQCIGLDISESMIKAAKEKIADLDNVALLTGDFLQTGLAEFAPFNMIFSMEVFYYFDDIQKGIDRSFQLLEPRGELWVLVDYYLENPFSHGWPEELDTPMTLWGMKDYVRGFEKAGFRNIRHNQVIDESSRARKPDDQGTLITSGVKPL